MSQVSCTVLTKLGEYLDLNICSLEFLGGLKCVGELYFGNLLLGPAVEESAAGCAAVGCAAGPGGLEPAQWVSCPPKLQGLPHRPGSAPVLPKLGFPWVQTRRAPAFPYGAKAEADLAPEVAAVGLSLFLGRSRMQEEL